MKSTMWKLVAVCGLGLTLGFLGQGNQAEAYVCPNNGWACNTAANCVDFCGTQLAICNRAKCCHCVP